MKSCYIDLDAFCREQGWDGRAAVPFDLEVLPCTREACGDAYCPGWKVANRERVTICSWCPDADERTRQATAEGKAVTHGICVTCADQVRR